MPGDRAAQHTLAQREWWTLSASMSEASVTRSPSAGLDTSYGCRCGVVLECKALLALQELAGQTCVVLNVATAARKPASARQQAAGKSLTAMRTREASVATIRAQPLQASASVTGQMHMKHSLTDH